MTLSRLCASVALGPGSDEGERSVYLRNTSIKRYSRTAEHCRKVGTKGGMYGTSRGREGLVRLRIETSRSS